MACNCGANKTVYVRDPLKRNPEGVNTLTGGYAYLKPHQLSARLEIYKRNNCKDCEKRFACDYTMYLKCKVEPTVTQP